MYTSYQRRNYTELFKCEKKNPWINKLVYKHVEGYNESTILDCKLSIRISLPPSLSHPHCVRAGGGGRREKGVELEMHIEREIKT